MCLQVRSDKLRRILHRAFFGQISLRIVFQRLPRRIYGLSGRNVPISAHLRHRARKLRFDNFSRVRRSLLRSESLWDMSEHLRGRFHRLLWRSVSISSNVSGLSV